MIVPATWLIYRMGQNHIEKTAQETVTETIEKVTENLNQFLQIPYQVEKLNLAALKAGTLKLDNLEQIHRHLILQHQSLPQISSLMLGTTAGDFLVSHRVSDSDLTHNITNLTPEDLPYEKGRSFAKNPDQMLLYAINPQGESHRFLQSIHGLDVRDRPWYRQATLTQKPGWTEPFQLGTTPHLTINYYMPIYDENQNIQGVMGANVRLEKINQFLATLSVGENGKVFIMDREGLLVANSALESTYLTEMHGVFRAGGVDQTTMPGQVEFRRLGSTESSNSLIRHAAKLIRTRSGSLKHVRREQTLDVQIEGDRHFIRVVPYQDAWGLDWLVVVVVPLSDFGSEIAGLTHQIVAWCLLAMAIAGGVSVWIAQRVTLSLQQLGHTARAYATSGQVTALPTTLIREVDALQQAFTTMMATIEAHQGELATHIQNQELEHFFLSSLDLLCITDTDGYFQRLNHQWEATLGYPLAVLEGTCWLDFVHPEDWTRTLTYFATLQQQQTVLGLVNRYRCRDGSYRWIEWKLLPADGCIYGSARDISDHRQMEQQLRHLNAELQQLATFDELTQVANRRHMDARLQQAWQRCDREQTALGLILLDIDHFKAYNDHYGHPQGDQCLRQVAQVLKDVVTGTHDLVARYGGEEFLIILPHTDPVRVRRVAERIQSDLQDLAIPHAMSSTSHYVTISMGLVIIQRIATCSIPVAIALADQALYRAKQTRNTYHLRTLHHCESVEPEPVEGV